MNQPKHLPTFQTFRVRAESTDRRLVHVRTLSSADAWHLASLIDPELFVHDEAQSDWRIVSVESAPNDQPVLIDESQPADLVATEQRLAESPDDELTPRRRRRPARPWKGAI